MQEDFYVAVDVHGLEILNHRLHMLASDPGTPNEGEIWYNSTDHSPKARVRKGSTDANRNLIANDDDFFNRLDEATTIQDADEILIWDVSAAPIDHQSQYRRITKANLVTGLSTILNVYNSILVDSGISPLDAIGSDQFKISADGAILKMIGSQPGGINQIDLTWLNQTTNRVFAAPGSGGAGLPGFRVLVDNDMPTSYNAVAWDSAYDHSQINPGNPHGVTLELLGYDNYWSRQDSVSPYYLYPSITTDELHFDVLNEYTIDAGVTIETVLIKDGLVDGYDISVKAPNWDTAYDHSQLTSGNPHSVAWTELSGVRTGITLSGFNDDLTYDNYVSWNLKTNAVQRIAVVKDGTLDITAGTNITVGYSAGGVVTINSTAIEMTYPDAGIALSTGTTWGISITDNSTNWNTAYSHSQITTGNPHSVAWTELAGARSEITLSGFNDDLTYDNYVSWNLKTNAVQRIAIISGGDLDITAGTDISVGYGTGGVVTINSTFTETSHSDVVQDGDFTSQGIMLRGVSTGVYAIMTGSSSVDTIETTLTNDNTHIPTSGAVYDAIQTVNSFLELTDTPANYTASGGFMVMVNSIPDGLEFIAPSGYGLSNFNDDLGHVEMTYPAVGIALSTGSTWDTSITDNSSTWNAAQPGHANLTSLAELTYASVSFVKMTASGTFSLDTYTYSQTGHVHAWGDITSGVPTTLSGYGISDTKANFNTALSDGTFIFTGDAPTSHTLLSHTVSGLTSGHFLKATGTTTFGFEAHGLTYTSVGAAPTSHAINDSTYGYGTSTLAGHLRSGTGLSITTGTIAVNYGTTNITACVGDDSRLSNARTPTSHASSHISSGGDAISLFATASTVSGLAPGSNSVGATYYLNASGAWTVPAGAPAYGADHQIPFMDGTTAFQYSANLVFSHTLLTVKNCLTVEGNTDGLERSSFKNVNAGSSRRSDIEIAMGAGSEAIYLGVDAATTLGVGTAYLDNRSGGAFSYFYNGAEQVTILSGGCAGIGDTTPSGGTSPDPNRKLMAEGGITVSAGNMVSFDKNFYVHAYQMYDSSLSGERDFYHFGYYGHQFSTRTGDALTILGNNNYVGIGTVNPGDKFEVFGGGILINSTLPSFRMYDSDATPGGTLRNFAIKNSGGNIQFFVANDAWTGNWTDRLVINTTGLVGIGLSIPEARLTVYEGTLLGSTAGSSQLIAEIAGNVGNYFNNRIFVYRKVDGSSWTSARTHDAISVDSSFGTPGTDTKCWYEREPNVDLHSWGSGTTTYAILRATGLGIGTDPSTKLHILDSSPILAVQTSSAGTVASPISRKLQWRNYINAEAGYINVIDQSYDTHRTDMIFGLRKADGTMFETMRINYLGYVGIGTSTPTEGNLHIDGTDIQRITLRRSPGVNTAITGSVRFTTDAAARYSEISGYRAADSSRAELIFSVYNVDVLKEAMRILYHGYVGIGTPNPLQLLHLNSATAQQGRIRLEETATGGVNSPGMVLYNETVFEGAFIYAEARDAVEIFTGASGTYPQLSLSGSTGIMTLRAYAGAGDQMLYVNNDGVVGKMDIPEPGSGGLSWTGTAAAGNIGTWGSASTVYANTYLNYTVATGTLKVTGNATNSILHLYSNDAYDTYVKFENDDAILGFIGCRATNGELHIVGGTSWATTTGIIINDSQLVGIGVSPATYKFQVAGTTYFSGTSYILGNVGIGAASSTQSLYVYDNTTAVYATYIYQVSGTGHGLQVKATSNSASYNIFSGVNSVGGVANLDTTGTWFAKDFVLSSDIILKDVYGTVTNGLDLVMKFNPVTFSWKDLRDNYIHTGLLAHQVRQIFPELVKEGSDGLLSLSYGKMSVLAIAGVQGLNHKVDTIEDQLRKRIEVLETKVKELQNAKSS